ncbi:MAG: hypothetical protein FWE32_03805 [Oscillospiraceae bacterium]|nr:hypothetical protein [Oscillospiraceae bacterium]
MEKGFASNALTSGFLVLAMNGSFAKSGVSIGKACRSNRCARKIYHKPYFGLSFLFVPDRPVYPTINRNKK